MKTRLLTALIALPILIAAVLLPKFVPASWAFWPFLLIAGGGLAAGLFEFYSLSKKLELKADAAVGYLGSAALFVAFLFDAPAKAPDLLLATVAGIIIITLVTQTFRFQKDFSKLLAGIGVTLLGVFYVAFLGGFIVSLRVGFEAMP